MKERYIKCKIYINSNTDNDNNCHNYYDNPIFSYLVNKEKLVLFSFIYIIYFLNIYLFTFSIQMKHFHVDDPSDLCSVKISGQDLREVLMMYSYT